MRQRKGETFSGVIYSHLFVGVSRNVMSYQGGLSDIGQTYHYTVILEREEGGGFHVYCPALPGCHTQGDSLDEALSNIREAILAYLESLKAHNEPLPREDLSFD